MIVKRIQANVGGAVKNSIVIKQASVYIDFTLPPELEEYDHRIMKCECGRWTEQGIGMCDQCINDDLDRMEEYDRKHK